VGRYGAADDGVLRSGHGMRLAAATPLGRHVRDDGGRRDTTELAVLPELVLLRRAVPGRLRHGQLDGLAAFMDIIKRLIDRAVAWRVRLLAGAGARAIRSRHVVALRHVGGTARSAAGLAGGGRS